MVEKIAEIYGVKMGRKLDPMKEVLVTQGANGALMSFINAFCNQGDGVVCFEPLFPNYVDLTEFAGGSVLGVPLTMKSSGEGDGDLKFDEEALRDALSKRSTKIFVFNTPHNPTGKVFSVEEM